MSTLTVKAIEAPVGFDLQMPANAVIDGQALTAYRSEWPSRTNIIINGGFDVWQRGTSFAVPANTKTYTADRWVAYDSTNTSTISRQSADNDGSQYACRVQRDSGQTGTATEEFEQAFETEDIAKYRGKNVTVSVYLKKGANYSATSDNLVMTLVTGTAGEATHLNIGFTGAVTNGTLTQAITSSSVKYSFTTTAVIASNVTQMALRFVKTPTGTAGADDWFQIEQVQLEAGSVATDFEIRNYATELAMCQRYFQLPGSWQAHSDTYTATAFKIMHSFPVTMRASPTIGTTGTPTCAKMNMNAAGPTTISVAPTANSGGFNGNSYTTMATGAGSAAATNTPYVGIGGFTADAEL